MSEAQPEVELTWVDEPPARRPPINWEPIIAQLQERPGEWAEVFDSVPISVPNAVRQGSVSAVHPSLGFEVRTSNNSPRGSVRTCTMFMRWTPPPKRKKG